MKLFKTLLCLVLSLSVFTPTISASASVNTITKAEPTKLESLTQGSQVVITDKEEIAIIAVQQNLAEPDKINKIIIDTVAYDTGHVDRNKYLNRANGYILVDIVDLGDRFSYWDVYTSYWYDGYLENTKTFKMTAAASYSATVGLSSDIFESTFGVSVNVTQEFTDETKIIVPANQRVNVKTWVNYQKKTYNVWDNGSVVPHYVGSGSLFIPVGLIITQTFYDK